MRGYRQPTMETELGTERQCARCLDYWPLDDEFWYFDKRTGHVMGDCKACWTELKRASRGRRNAA